jgi:hypothetical protein
MDNEIKLKTGFSFRKLLVTMMIFLVFFSLVVFGSVRVVAAGIKSGGLDSKIAKSLNMIAENFNTLFTSEKDNISGQNNVTNNPRLVEEIKYATPSPTLTPLVTVKKVINQQKKIVKPTVQPTIQNYNKSYDDALIQQEEWWSKVQAENQKLSDESKRSLEEFKKQSEQNMADFDNQAQQGMIDFQNKYGIK